MNLVQCRTGGKALCYWTGIYLCLPAHSHSEIGTMLQCAESGRAQMRGFSRSGCATGDSDLSGAAMRPVPTYIALYTNTCMN